MVEVRQIARIEKQPTTKGDYQKQRKARDRKQYFVQQSHEPIFARLPTLLFSGGCEGSGVGNSFLSDMFVLRASEDSRSAHVVAGPCQQCHDYPCNLLAAN